jgi:hypothetical protein
MKKRRKIKSFSGNKTEAVIFVKRQFLRIERSLESLKNVISLHSIELREYTLVSEVALCILYIIK